MVTELTASKYSEYKAWIDEYDKAHAVKNERELKAKALAAEINAVRMEFSKEALNSLLRQKVPNLHCLLKADESISSAQAQAEVEPDERQQTIRRPYPPVQDRCVVLAPKFITAAPGCSARI